MKKILLVAALLVGAAGIIDSANAAEGDYFLFGKHRFSRSDGSMIDGFNASVPASQRNKTIRDARRYWEENYKAPSQKPDDQHDQQNPLQSSQLASNPGAQQKSDNSAPKSIKGKQAKLSTNSEGGSATFNQAEFDAAMGN